MKETSFEIPNPLGLGKIQVIDLIRNEASKWIPKGSLITHTDVHMDQRYIAKIRYEEPAGFVRAPRKPVDMSERACPQCGCEQDTMAVAWAEGDQREAFHHICERCGAELEVTVFMVPLFQVELRGTPGQSQSAEADTSASTQPPEGS